MSRAYLTFLHRSAVLAVVRRTKYVDVSK